MNFRPWQWLVIVGLVVAFGVTAALLASGGDDADAPTTFVYDEVAWCQAAGAVQARGALLDLDADAPDGDLTNLRVALTEARASAPEDLKPGLARLLDLVLLTGEEVAAGATVDDARATALLNVDRPRVDAAIDALHQAIVACGHPSLTG